MKDDDTASDSRFEDMARALADEARGLIRMLRSVKDHLARHAKDDPLYRMTLRRLREDGIRLAAWFEAYSALRGDAGRDAMLSRLGCSWDDSKKRVDLGRE